MIEISLFGPTRVTEVGSGRSVDPGGPKPREILEILAAAGGRPVSKERLADLLWGGVPPRSFRTTLESYVCVLRRRLDLGMGRSSLLATTGDGYSLDGAIRVDLTEFRTRVRSAHAESDPQRRAQTSRAAVELLGGDLLASAPYAAWADQERRSFAADLAQVCEAGALAARAAGDLGTTIALGRAALRNDALHEEAAIILMEALAAANRRAEALQVYLGLRQALAESLDTIPSAPAQALYATLLLAVPAPGLDATHAEIRSLLDAMRTTLSTLPGLEVPEDDAALAAVAVRVISAA